VTGANAGLQLTRHPRVLCALGIELVDERRLTRPGGIGEFRQCRRALEALPHSVLERVGAVRRREHYPNNLFDGGNEVRLLVSI
jgi:hypothetical protein